MKTSNQTRTAIVIAIILLCTLSIGCGGDINVTLPGCEDCPERCLGNEDGTRGRCVTCLKDAQCQSTSSPTRRCSQDNKCICGTDRDCTNGRRCAGAAGCKECLENKDCKDGKVCVNDKCETCQRGDTQECTPTDPKACGQGTQTCQPTLSWGKCEPNLTCKDNEVCEEGKCVDACKPTVETCNGKDDDCNGKTDDNPTDIGGKCSVPGQDGVCADSRFTCEGGAKVCKQTNQITDETCNGKDDDCDGEIDNLPDLGKKCNDPNRNGICKPGTWACKNNEKVCEQTTQPTKETCDSQDNDCNGKIDDNIECSCTLNDPPKDCYTGPANTEGTGVCKKGQQKCESFSGGFRWGKCIGEIIPKAETCNGVDDDCDGKDDNNPTDVDKPCVVKGAKGACAQGKTVCQASSILCKQVNQPQAETCNNQDDNCDGTIDNIADLGKTCTDSNRKGICQAGVWICKNSQKLCNQIVQPGAETCNGKDDDCDGTVDDVPAGKACTDTSRKGICQAGITTCEKGKEICKQSVQPTAETCNGKDDNCDGTIDNIADLGKTCIDTSRKGVCQAGLWKCQNNQKVCEQSVQASSQEACGNLRDDDCNGVIDDGCPCNYRGKGQGVCRNSVSDNQGICQKPSAYSSSEICGDLLDNDCNGIIDDGC